MEFSECCEFPPRFLSEDVFGAEYGRQWTSRHRREIRYEGLRLWLRLPCPIIRRLLAGLQNLSIPCLSAHFVCLTAQNLMCCRDRAKLSNTFV